MTMSLEDRKVQWVSFVLGLIVLVSLAPRVGAQTACAVRVDLRWIDTLPSAMTKPVQPAPGVTLPAPEARTINDFLGTRIGPVYWQEAAKKRYPDICLDVEHADYFVYWNQVRGDTNVFVFPRRESGCVVAKIVFSTEKFNKDSEHSTKEAFKETLSFLRTNGKADYSLINGCMAPESIEHASDTLSRLESEKVQSDSSSPPIHDSDSPSAVLDISSSPSGADIELDGSFIGNTPSSIAIPVGEHALTITKKGYGRWARKINALAGKISIAAELEVETKPTQPPER